MKWSEGNLSNNGLMIETEEAPKPHLVLIPAQYQTKWWAYCVKLE